MLIGPGGSVEDAGRVDVRPSEIDVGEQPERSTLTRATRSVRFRPVKRPRRADPAGRGIPYSRLYASVSRASLYASSKASL